MKKNVLITVIVIVVLLVIGLILVAGKQGPLFAPASQCNDRYDNDGDGKCDYGSSGFFNCKDGSARGDTGCSSKSDNSEAKCAVGSTTCGVGACQSSSTCVNDASSCTPGTPTNETCDSVDNDCNGVVDNLGSSTCGVGACLRTVQKCISGQTQTCVAGTPGTEICGNGIDEDCNGADLTCTNTTISNSCSDTDGGLAIFTKGTVSGFINGIAYSYTDSCFIANGTSTDIREYYCGTSLAFNQIRSCAGNLTGTCSNGACV